MPSVTHAFETLDDPNRIAFQVELPEGTAPAFATIGKNDVEVGGRFWNSYDGELYRVSSVDEESVEAILEFGCGEIPRDVSFARERFMPDSHSLHHITPQTD